MFLRLSMGRRDIGFFVPALAGNELEKRGGAKETG